MKGNPDNYTASLKSMLKSVIMSGRLISVVLYFIKRLYSQGQFYILRRDLTVPIETIHNDIPLRFRLLRQDDIPKFLYAEPSLIKIIDPLERLRLMNMFNVGFQNCYVTVIDDDKPCHLCWLINSGENERIFHEFKGGIQPLAPDEVLIENTFTLEQYRRRGIQSWSIQKLIEKSAEIGAKSAFAYVRNSNTNSLKSFKKNGCCDVDSLL